MKWLFDEMFSPKCAEMLRELGHDAVSVYDTGLTGHNDEEVFALAVDENRILVTENFGDFSVLLEWMISRGEPCTPMIFVRGEDIARGSALPDRLATLLDRWSTQNPDPYVGPHWPK